LCEKRESGEKKCGGQNGRKFQDHGGDCDGAWKMKFMRGIAGEKKIDRLDALILRRSPRHRHCGG
jgi:hypothetical protein